MKAERKKKTVPNTQYGQKYVDICLSEPYKLSVIMSSTVLGRFSTGFFTILERWCGDLWWPQHTVCSWSCSLRAQGHRHAGTVSGPLGYSEWETVTRQSTKTLYTYTVECFQLYGNNLPTNFWRTVDCEVPTENCTTSTTEGFESLDYMESQTSKVLRIICYYGNNMRTTSQSCHHMQVINAYKM